MAATIGIEAHIQRSEIIGLSNAARSGRILTLDIQYGASNQVELLFTKKERQENTKSIYQKWLDEDVGWIITGQERQAFSGLRSDNEREQFIQAFWQRRDDKPETKENEFRREYYGRIAYVNGNFAFGGAKGCETDRGRMFIKYGKPDEVQKNDFREVWIYKSLPDRSEGARFEFEDAAKNGNYRLRQ